MTRTTPRHPGALLNRDRVRALLAAGTVLGLGAVGTMAVWTDQSTATSGQFSTGTVDLKVGSPAVDDDPAKFKTDLSLSGMKPGSTKNAVLAVSNAGTLPFTYNLTSSATNSGAGNDQLGAALDLQIYAGTGCTGTPINAPQKINGTTLSAARPLTASSSESLCFKVTLPSNANTALQGKNSVATFTLTATGN